MPTGMTGNIIKLNERISNCSAITCYQTKRKTVGLDERVGCVGFEIHGFDSRMLNAESWLSMIRSNMRSTGIVGAVKADTADGEAQSEASGVDCEAQCDLGKAAFDACTTRVSAALRGHRNMSHGV